MTQSVKRIHVVAIDFQDDFCRPGAPLFVDNADNDARNFADLVTKVGHRVEMFHLTMDSHHPRHVAHACAWRSRGGNRPDHYQIIPDDEVQAGEWRAEDPRLDKWYKYYTAQLKKNGRFPLRIWPEHCLIGTPGHNIVPCISAALREWATNRRTTVNFVTKGSNPHTEHYSALQADVPVDKDPSTKLNIEFLKTVGVADEIWLMGEASSHCVAFTGRDMADNFDQAQLQKFVIFKNLMSPVGVAKADADKFFSDMVARGVRVVDRYQDYI